MPHLTSDRNFWDPFWGRVFQPLLRLDFAMRVFLTKNQNQGHRGLAFAPVFGLLKQAPKTTRRSNPKYPTSHPTARPLRSWISLELRECRTGSSLTARARKFKIPEV